MKHKEQILKLREQGYTYNQICKELGCSKGTVSYHLGKHTGRKYRQAPTVCKCGAKKSYDSEQCQTCYNKERLQKQLQRTLKDIQLIGNARVKWSSLRKVAHTVLEYAKRPKCCVVCGFDVSVDLCHIKPIHSFSEDALVAEVNSEENLIYLCPNHHRMLDRGLLEL